MDIPNVVIGIPHAGPLPGYFWDATMGLIKPPGGVGTLRVERKPVDLARNAIVEGFLAQPEARWLFFMDADMKFHPHTLKRLIDHNLPIVSGTYFARTDHPVPHVYDYVRTDALGTHWYHPKGAELVATMRAHPEMAGKPNAYCHDFTALVECDAVGAGCLLIRRDVIEAIPEPWFRNSEGSAGGEDFDFCAKAKAAGYPIHADFAIQCDHEAVQVFTGQAEFREAFGIGKADEYNFRDPLVVQVGPTGQARRVSEADAFRFPYDVEGYLTPDEGRALFHLALLTPPGGTVVDLGSYKGKSTICLAQAGRRVYAVDSFKGDPDEQGAHPDHLSGNYFNEFGRNLGRYVAGADIHVAVAWSVEYGRAWDRGHAVDLLFIDADHAYEAVKADFEAWLPNMAPDGTIAFHDANFPAVAQFIGELVADGGWEVPHATDTLVAIKRSKS